MRTIVQADLFEVTPLYGIEIAGSEVYDAYVTSYYVLYGDDGNVFSFLTENGAPKVIEIVVNEILINFDSNIFK